MAGGRPSKIDQWRTEDGLAMMTHWKRNDLTDEEIAKKIGIARPTLIEWKKRYPDVADALKKGMEVAISDAEEALISKFQRYEYKETSVETWEEAGKVTKTHKKVTNRVFMPDTAAIIFFLKAKAGWRDNTDVRSAVDQISPERRKEIEELFKNGGEQ